MLVKLSPYLIAMCIGLMIGVERERRSIKGHQSMGVRSFLLFGLVGAIAGGINQPFVSLGLVLFAATATLAGYLRTTTEINSPDHTVGLTTEIAAMATFALGYFANFEPLLSLVLGTITFTVLLNKTFLHTFTKQRLKPNELQAGATLLLLAVGVIPLIPNETIDPFNIFNPRRLGVIIALIAGIQFLGYAASRLFGHRIGMPLSGFLAGNISSTAAFVSYPRLAKLRAKNYLSIASAATFAVTATLSQLTVLLAAISWELVIALTIPLISIIFTCSLIGLLLALKYGASKIDDEEEETAQNPLSLTSAIKLGCLLTAIIFIVELSERFLGGAFTKIVTFLGALFELHGVAIAGANMFENHTTDINTAASTVLAAITASLVSKVVLTAIIAVGNYRRLMLSITSLLLLMSVIFWLLIKLTPAMLISIN